MIFKIGFMIMHLPLKGQNPSDPRRPSIRTV